MNELGRLQVPYVGAQLVSRNHDHVLGYGLAIDSRFAYVDNLFEMQNTTSMHSTKIVQALVQQHNAQFLHMSQMAISKLFVKTAGDS